MRTRMLPSDPSKLLRRMRAPAVAPAVALAALLLAAAVSPLTATNLASASVDPVLDANAYHGAGATDLALRADADAAGAGANVHSDGDALDADASAHAAGRDASAGASTGPSESSGSRTARGEDPERNATIAPVWDLAIEPDHQGVPAGGRAYYDVIARNPWNHSLDVKLAIAKTTSGWTAFLSERAVTLPPHGEARVTLELQAPRDAYPGARGTVTVEGRAAGVDGARYASAEATVMPPPPYGGASATMSPGEQKAEPGTSVTFVFTIKHGGNTRERYDFLVDAGDWPAKASPSNATLAPGESAKARVTVFVPANASAPAERTITAYADALSPWGMNAKASATVHVVAPPPPPPEYGVDLAFTPAKQGVRAGESALYHLQIKSTGDVEQTVTLKLGPVPDGWTATLESRSVTLAPGENRTLAVKLAAPYHARSGESAKLIAIAHVREAGDAPEAFASAGAYGYVDAGPWYAARVTTSAVKDQARPGEWLAYTGTVTNRGDRLDTFELSVRNDRGFATNLSHATVTLKPGETAHVGFGAQVPEGAEAGNVTFTFTATSRGDARATASAKTAGTVLPPPYDYGVTGDFADGNHRYAEPGENVTFTLRLTNGNATHGFHVRTANLSQGWSSAVTEDAFLLAPGESRDVTITVTVPKCTDLSKESFDVVAYAARRGDAPSTAHFDEVLRLSASVQVVHSDGVIGAGAGCAFGN